MDLRSENAKLAPNRHVGDDSCEVLVLYLKRPQLQRLNSWVFARGRFRYSDLKEAALRDYGICIWMGRT